MTCHFTLPFYFGTLMPKWYLWKTIVSLLFKAPKPLLISSCKLRVHALDWLSLSYFATYFLCSLVSSGQSVDPFLRELVHPIAPVQLRLLDPSTSLLSHVDSIHSHDPPSPSIWIHFWRCESTHCSTTLCQCLFSLPHRFFQIWQRYSVDQEILIITHGKLYGDFPIKSAFKNLI